MKTREKSKNLNTGWGCLQLWLELWLHFSFLVKMLACKNKGAFIMKLGFDLLSNVQWNNCLSRRQITRRQNEWRGQRKSNQTWTCFSLNHRFPSRENLLGCVGVDSAEEEENVHRNERRVCCWQQGRGPLYYQSLNLPIYKLTGLYPHGDQSKSSPGQGIDSFASK